jgi:hypothetical protein
MIEVLIANGFWMGKKKDPLRGGVVELGLC